MRSYVTSRREREVARLGLLLLVCVFSGVAGSGNGLAAPVQFGTGACQAQVDDPNAYAIIHEVFDVKSDELARAGLLSGDFWAKNRDLGFAICNNKGSYDAFVVYGKGVVFDYQMVKFL